MGATKSTETRWMSGFGICFLLIIFLLLPFLLRAQDVDVDDETCLDCHEDHDVTLVGTVHQLRGQDHSSAVKCSDCHSGAEVHLEDPEIDNITNPSKISADKASVVCRTCHYTDHQQHMGERNAHSENDVNCSSCHKVHDNKRLSLLKDKEPELCFGCHAEARGEFSSPYRHPVADGIVKCSECHKHLGDVNDEFAAGGLANTCYDCHNEFRGPFPHEHQAAVEYSTEEGGCLNCHAAHGSNLPRMLTQPVEPPNFALCSQCHIVPGHQMNSYHGDKWANRQCLSCHTDIHGSYINKYLLNPNLPDEEGENCFGVGCHNS